MKVTLRARARNSMKFEFFDDDNKVIGVLDSQEVREVNPVSDQDRFKFAMVTDNLTACEDLFKCGYENLEKVHFYLPKDFMGALNELLVAAHKKQIPFKPSQKMLRALYREAERLRVQLRTEGEDMQGILKYKEIFKLEEDEKVKELKASPGARIVAAMLQIKGPYFDEFNEIAAANYGKTAHSVKMHRLRGYAMGLDESSNWACAVALEVLKKNKINVFNLGIDEASIKEIWLKSNKQDGEARFNALFKNAK